MKIFIAVICYIVAVFSILHNWLLVAFITMVVCSVQYGALVFIPAAIIIDGYFGNYYHVPFLSFAAIAWFVVIEYVRPRILALSEPEV